MNLYWAQSLAKGSDLVTATGVGIADVAALNAHQEPGKLPLSMVGQLPGIGNGMWARATGFWDLMNQEPLLSEYTKNNLRPLAVVLSTDQAIISNIPIRSVADIEGKKISGAGMIAQTIAALGGVPVAMAPGEQYEGLQRGTIDGVAAPAAAIWDFKFYEVGKYYTVFELGYRVQPVVINQDKWNEIPADIQKIMLDSVPDCTIIAADAFIKDTDILAMQTMKDNGVEIIQPSAADKAAVKKVQAGQADAWAADLEAKGIPGKKVLDDFRSLVEKYDKVDTYAYE